MTSTSNGAELNESNRENLAFQFKTGLDNYNGILTSDKPTNSVDVQVCITNMIFVPVGLISCT